MPIELNSEDALITAAKTTTMPVAFLVGSPLSKDSRGGVPGINQMLAFVLDEVKAKAPSQLDRYNKTMDGKTEVEAYETAMKWLQANLTQDAVNRVVERAVRQARKPGAPTDFDYDGIPGDWHIPQGTQQIAELVTRQREQFLGPILTTNFDPLLSLAIESVGGRANLRVIDSDGNVGRIVEKRPGIIDIVHLHGYWRNSDTLHTPAQLTAARPKLKASLQNLLRQRTLIVVAYSGWDDVFTTALAELLNDDDAKLNVLWCFYETDPAIVETKYKALLARVALAITRGRFIAYGGIDCHLIFGEVGGLPVSPVTDSASHLSPLAGWDRIDSTYLAALASLTQEEIIRYFDGAVPTWRHAISDAIPHRKAVSEITNRLATLEHAKGDCSIQLIRAAGGEGKTTLLLQAAADITRRNGWEVLWRPSPRIGLSPETVVRLDVAKQWLIVADDADNLVRDLTESARLLHQAGRTNVHFLLAARDVDWLAKDGDKPAWDMWLKSWVNRRDAIVLRGITPEDAKVFVAAWGKCGAEGLRELALLADPAKQVAALESAVQDAVTQQNAQSNRRKPTDGSLFGGLLVVRFGQSGLQAHVRAFLNRLKTMHIEGSRNSLFDALLYAAACHSVGIPGIDENVLADLLAVPRDWVQSRVVRPLGEEAAAVQSAGHVLTRHSQVAAAVLEEAEQSLGVDLAEVWARLVRQTVRSGRDFRIQSFNAIVHAGPRLQRDLPKLLSEDRRRVIAIEAAKADVVAEPDRLVALVDLGKTYLLAGDPDEAVSVFRDNLAHASAKVDFANVIRGYWSEWSVCEGERGTQREHTIADAWLCGLSLSDHLNPAPITEDDAKLICAGLGVAFGKLAEPRPNCSFAKARRAASYLGRQFGYDPHGHYFDRYDREADKIKTPHPNNNAEAIAWLTVGVAQAGREIKDPFLSNLAKPDQVSFSLLRSILSVKRKS